MALALLLALAAGTALTVVLRRETPGRWMLHWLAIAGWVLVAAPLAGARQENHRVTYSAYLAAAGFVVLLLAGGQHPSRLLPDDMLPQPSTEAEHALRRRVRARGKRVFAAFIVVILAIAAVAAVNIYREP